MNTFPDEIFHLIQNWDFPKVQDKLKFLPPLLKVGAMEAEQLVKITWFDLKEICDSQRECSRRRNNEKLNFLLFNRLHEIQHIQAHQS